MTVDADRIRQKFSIREYGAGTQPILFAHGFGGDQNVWSAVAPAFSDTHRVILFDSMGAGGSDIRAYDPKRYSDLRGYAGDVLEICQALDLREVLFVGHSVGGMIGLLAAAERPERFALLSLIGVTPRYLNDGGYQGGFEREALEELLDLMNSNFLGWSATLVPLMIGTADPSPQAQQLIESFGRADPEITRQFARVTFFSDNRPVLARVLTPTVILQCTGDVMVPDTAASYLHAHLPQSRLVRLAATDHCPQLTDPDEVIEVLRSYLHDAEVG